MTDGVASSCILHDFVYYQSGRLAFGGHTVRVDATDGELGTPKIWRFTVVRRG